MRSSSEKKNNRNPELNSTVEGFDNDSPSVSLAFDASPNSEDDGVIIVSWRRGSAAEDHLPDAPPLEMYSAVVGPRPKASKRQRRTHELIRGAETRAVRTRSKDIYTGDVPLSRLEGKLVSGEGLGEILAWIVIDFLMEDMTEAYAQADKVQISMFGVLHDWTPDGHIKRTGKRDLLLEVKPLEAVQPGQDTDPVVAVAMRERVRAMKAYAKATDRDFLLLTEYELKMEPRFHNSKVMFRALGANIPEPTLEYVFYRLHQLDEVLSVRDLAEAIPQHRNSMLMIACLLDRSGFIRLDRKDFFCPDTEFENYLGSSHMPRFQ